MTLKYAWWKRRVQASGVNYPHTVAVHTQGCTKCKQRPLRKKEKLCRLWLHKYCREIRRTAPLETNQGAEFLICEPLDAAFPPKKPFTRPHTWRAHDDAR
jgi:hypothetical protein